MKKIKKPLTCRLALHPWAVPQKEALIVWKDQFWLYMSCPACGESWRGKQTRNPVQAKYGFALSEDPQGYFLFPYPTISHRW